MSDDTDDAYPLQVGTGTAVRFADDAKELAYQLWAFECGGDCVKVSRRLATADPPVKVDPRSVQRWALGGQWAIRRADDWRRIAPDLSRQLVIETRYGLLESARMARDMVADSEATNKERIMAGSLLAKIDSDIRALAIPDPPTNQATDDADQDDPSLPMQERLDRARRRMQRHQP